MASNQMKQAIGEAVKKARESKGISRNKLAHNVTLLSGKELRTTRVDAIEQGNNYTIDTLTTVLEALELKLIIK